MKNNQSNRFRTRNAILTGERLLIISDGKPGTIALLLSLRKELSNFDFNMLLDKLDSLGIYGSNLFKTYYEFFNSESENFSNFNEYLVLLSNDYKKIISLKQLLRIFTH